jgi:hypothetical protein
MRSWRCGDCGRVVRREGGAAGDRRVVRCSGVPEGIDSSEWQTLARAHWPRVMEEIEETEDLSPSEEPGGERESELVGEESGNGSEDGSEDGEVAGTVLERLVRSQVEEVGVRQRLRRDEFNFGPGTGMGRNVNGRDENGVLVEANVVLSVRPGALDVLDLPSLVRWVRSGGLGAAAAVAGHRPSEVTHVRLEVAGRVLEVAVEDLARAMAFEDGDWEGEGEGGGDEVFRSASERVRELGAAVREIGSGLE